MCTVFRLFLTEVLLLGTSSSSGVRPVLGNRKSGSGASAVRLNLCVTPKCAVSESGRLKGTNLPRGKERRGHCGSYKRRNVQVPYSPSWSRIRAPLLHVVIRPSG